MEGRHHPVAPCTEPADDDGRVQGIRHRHVNLGPQGNADQRTGNGRSLAQFGECEDSSPGLIVSQQVPVAFHDLELQLQYPVHESPGGVPVVVEDDLCRGGGG